MASCHPCAPGSSARPRSNAMASRSDAPRARRFTLFLLGRLEDSGREAAAAIALGESVGDAAVIAAGCRVEGLVLSQSGRREEGRDRQRRALDIAARLGKPSL